MKGAVSLSRRIFVAAALPMVALLVVVSVDVSRGLSLSARGQAAQERTEVSLAAGSLLHALQRERGATGIFLASEGASFGQALTESRAETDAASRVLDVVAARASSGLPAGAGGALASIGVSRSRLPAERRAISTLSGVEADHTAFYVDLYDALLTLIGETSGVAVDAETARKISAELSLLTASEKLGRLRAQMGSVYTRRAFSPGQRDLVVSLLAAYDTELATFRRLSEGPIVAAVDQAVSTPQAVSTRTLIETALAGPPGVEDGLNIAPAVWFDTATSAIEALSNVEDVNARQIRSDTTAVLAATRRSLILQGLLLLVMMVAIWWQVVRVGRRLDQGDAELRRTTAELKALNTELDAFSYGVAHDLRAPLRTIDGFARLIEEDDGGLSPEVMAHLRRVRAGAARLKELIDALLALARSGSRTPVLVTVDPALLIQRVWDELMIQNPDRRVDLTVVDLPACRADPVLLSVVLTNLLGNAVKFTRDSDPAHIEIVGHSQEGWATYTVKDNGVGFNPAQTDRIFGVFQRLHSESAFEGTGVGLALTERIIRRHGGQITAASPPGEGAIFSFTLPSAVTSVGHRFPSIPRPRMTARDDASPSSQPHASS